MGYVHIIRDYFSGPERQSRTVRIYTPDAYDQDGERRFPVVYMQDGQNAFAHPESARFETWCANFAIERTAAEGRTDPWIIVAVDHGVDRFTEYSPWDEPRLGIHARGPLYVQFLAEELKPYIDRTYRTEAAPERTAIMGSSLGGLISLYAGLARPDVFGRVGAFSPTVMWSLGKIHEHWHRHSGRWSRIYLDVGTEEAQFQGHIPLDYPRGVVGFYHHLKSLGYQDWEVKLVVEHGAGHHELDWQRRLPDAMAWLLGNW